MESEDTETLIALVASLLLQSQQTPSQDAIIDALIQANGDATIAANILLSLAPAPQQTKKRKSADLESWLKPKYKARRKTVQDEPIASTSATTFKTTASDSKANASRRVLSTNLMAVLRQPPSPQKRPSRMRPLILSSPEMIAKHTPCTMHLAILPPELACRLFYTMIDASEAWKKNKWWLFDRVVESPHLTSFFARSTDGFGDDEAWQEAAQYWYNGRMTDPPAKFPPEMEEACKIVEIFVNEEIAKREKLFKLEWTGSKSDSLSWRANVAASNCYRGGKECVGFHSDQLTYLGPYPTIASLSLGTRRTFSLREVVPTDQAGVRSAQTFNIPLPHNSLIIMHASCQERFKHSIPPQSAVDLFRPTHSRLRQGHHDTGAEPSNYRVNITFRFYRPDFRPASIPRCECGVPAILRPDMKNRNDEETDRYWWTCYAGAQNEGKGCNFWKVMDMKEEGRGPYGGITESTVPQAGTEN